MIGRAHIAQEAIRLQPLIEAALEHETRLYTMRDVVDHLLTGRVVLWSDTRAAVITCIHEYPQGKSCALWLAGGDLDQILAMEPQIIEYARANGCVQLEVHGRAGWARKLQSRGYRNKSVNLTKPILLAASADPPPTADASAGARVDTVTQAADAALTLEAVDG